MNLQFLNLDGRGKTPIPVNAVRTERINRARCFKFTLPPNPEDALAKRSYVRDIRICDAIAQRLRQKGFVVGKAKRGKPWGAVFCVSFEGFSVTIMLNANCQPRHIKCDGITWIGTARRHPAAPKIVDGGWATTRQALEAILCEDFGARSFEWKDE